MAPQNKRWNLFARELEDILTAHGLRLGQLDDRPDLSIHREKIRRLQQSLLMPKSFPVLNPQEIDLLVETFELSQEEHVRLRAALLATAIERMLMGRIDLDNALLASEQIQMILYRTLLTHAEQESGVGSVRGGDSDSIEDTEGDIAWRRALDEYDYGNMAYQLGYEANSYSERLKYMREADTHYTESSTELNGLDEDWQSLPSWQPWRDEIDAGIALTKQQLKDLGAE